MSVFNGHGKKTRSGKKRFGHSKTPQDSRKKNIKKYCELGICPLKKVRGRFPENKDDRCLCHEQPERIKFKTCCKCMKIVSP